MDHIADQQAPGTNSVHCSKLCANKSHTIFVEDLVHNVNLDVTKFQLKTRIHYPILSGEYCKSMFPFDGPPHDWHLRRARSEENMYYSWWGPQMYSPAPHFPVQGYQYWGPNGAPLMPPPPVPRQNKRYYSGTNNRNLPCGTRQEATDCLKVLSKRHWLDVYAENSEKKSSFEFVLMSYNVLAQKLIDEHLYLYKRHNRKTLNWQTRWSNLFNEIKTMKPDVLCLQEVQESHLKDYYSKLETLGYRSLYKRRTGLRCDGCAIYYKINKLRLVEYDTVEFYQPEVAVLNRDNIAIIAKFAPRHCPERNFIVATTHLLYNPKRQDVRLAQTQLLLTEVERLSYHKSSNGTAKYWPIIITGDFNSTPESPVYKLITEGYFKYDHLAERRLHRPESPKQGKVLVPSTLEVTDRCQHASLVEKRQNEVLTRNEEIALIKLHRNDKTIAKITTETLTNPDLEFSSGTLSHLFAFKSVYQHGTAEDPEGTTFQDEWITVDYIFYSGKRSGEQVDDHKLKLLSLYRLPLRSELGSLTIPNGLMGSDHLSLVARFKLKL